MKLLFSLAVVVICLTIYNYSKSGDNADVTWKNSRDYEVIVFDLEGQAFLKADVTYLGKSLPVGEQTHQDWKKIDTDFYRVGIENIGSHSFTLDLVEYSLDKGKLMTKKLKLPSTIKEWYSVNELFPGDRIERENAYAWSYSNNVLHRVFSVNLLGEIIKVDLPLVYKK